MDYTKQSENLIQISMNGLKYIMCKIRRLNWRGWELRERYLVVGGENLDCQAPLPPPPRLVAGGGSGCKAHLMKQKTASLQPAPSLRPVSLEKRLFNFHSRQLNENISNILVRSRKWGGNGRLFMTLALKLLNSCFGWRSFYGVNKNKHGDQFQVQSYRLEIQASLSPYCYVQDKLLFFLQSS